MPSMKHWPRKPSSRQTQAYPPVWTGQFAVLRQEHNVETGRLVSQAPPASFNRPLSPNKSLAGDLAVMASKLLPGTNAPIDACASRHAVLGLHDLCTLHAVNAGSWSFGFATFSDPQTSDHRLRRVQGFVLYRSDVKTAAKLSRPRGAAVWL